MRSLYLLRHAKSSWEDSSLRDHDRPLAPRGRRAALAMGQYMAKEGLIPEFVFCSTAVRTRETWALIEPQLGPGVQVAYDRELYAASPGTLLDFIQAVPDGVQRALLIGHNPGIQALAASLARSGSADGARQLARKYPTCALVELSCDVDHWTDVASSGCRLARFVRPRDLPSTEKGDL